MSALQLVGQTHVAFLTMEKPLTAANPANSAAFAVVLVFVFVIKQLTF